MKLHLYIHNLEYFLAENYQYCFRVVSDRERFEHFNKDYVYAGAVDVEIDVDRKTVTQIAVKQLDDQIKEIRAVAQKGVEAIEQRKQNLMALEHHV